MIIVLFVVDVQRKMASSTVLLTRHLTYAVLNYNVLYAITNCAGRK